MNARILDKFMTSEVLMFPTDQSINNVLARMLEKRVSSALILEGFKEIKGIVTERDLVRKMVRLHPDKLDRPVRTIMSVPVRFGYLPTLVEDIARLHIKHGKRHFPILKDPEAGPFRENLAGMLTVTDICRMYLFEIMSKARQSAST